MQKKKRHPGTKPSYGFKMTAFLTKENVDNMVNQKLIDPKSKTGKKIMKEVRKR